MRRNLAGLRAVVTGASRGIGRLTAERLAAAGCKLVLAARSAEPLHELAKSLPAAVAVPADLTTDAGRLAVRDAAVRQFGGLDLLVNNAGVASWGHFATSTPDILRTVTETNFFAPAELIRVCLPLLTEGATPAVLNVASLCGKRGLPAWPEHSGAKMALVGLTEALRGEFARFGVDVLLVVPGLTRSHDLGRHLLRHDGKADLDFETATPPEAVADAIVSALRTGRRETLVGRDTRRLVLAHRLAPGFVTRMISRKVRRLYAAG
jgi:short-subunit dehydrogenase